MMLQNGVNMSKPQGKLAEDALVFYTLFSKTDGVWNETLPPSTSAFAAGKLAMYFGPSWRYFNIKEQNPDLNFRTVPLPQLPKGDPNEPNVSYATYWATGVWTRSSNKDQAWAFLKFIASKDSLEKEFAQASASRGFGEAYPRVDLANSLLEHPILGSIIKLAPEAQSWFLADRTFDGATGINAQIKKYFEDAINAVNKGDSAQDALEPLTLGVQQILSQYGLIKQ
jgi:ABC-type glycerol-3-phosphate transport system substrate-binding protein